MSPIESMEMPIEDAIPESAENPMETIGEEALESAFDGDILKNLEAGQIYVHNEVIEPEVMERLSQVQSKEYEEEGGVVRQFIDKVQDVIEDVLEFFGIDTDRTDFNREEFEKSIESGADQWHEQLEPYSCAIACQQFIISEYTDNPVTEQELIQLATEMNWYEEFGTPVTDIGNILMAYGIDYTVKTRGSFDDLLEASANGDRVMAFVQNMAMTTEWADGYPALSANHMVEVLGVDNSDPKNPRVIVNDPGIPNGQAMSMTRENFEDAWMTSGGYMCVAHRPEGNLERS